MNNNHKSILRTLRKAANDQIKNKLNGFYYSFKFIKMEVRKVRRLKQKQNKVSLYKRNLAKIRPVVKSFRGKNDPYMNLTSQFELK